MRKCIDAEGCLDYSEDLQNVQREEYSGKHVIIYRFQIIVKNDHGNHVSPYFTLIRGHHVGISLNKMSVIVEQYKHRIEHRKDK